MRPLLSARRALRVPKVADILVVAATIAYALTNDYFDQPGRYWSWVFDIALAVPLFWRKRHPLEVFIAISLIACADWLSDTPASGSIAVLIALYSVGAHEPRRRAVFFAAALTEVGAVMATLRWAPPDHRLAAVVLLTGTVTAAWALGVYARTRRAFLAAALERAATAERERDHQAMLATAAERARISRETHDIVAHTLSVMVALSDGAALSVVRSPDSARDAMEKSATLGRQALSDLRRLLGGLRSPDEVELAPAPGIEEVEELVAAVRAAGLPVELVMSGLPPAMPPGLQVAVYRVVQESLTNVLKHAPGATHVVVSVSYEPGTIHIEVVNDGLAEHAPGASPPERESEGPGGQGIAGMKERAAVFDGSLTAGPEPYGVWRVEAHLQLEQEEAGR